ncbi:MAG TPA: HAD family hydrolase [Dehalococcoidia bacterium]|jgi:putative hydrolase of the HAD superfamily|nr:HAD family hydrolase [Dehalococcoidia bacterium]
MIKAVFFDLYQTLVRYEPPREELQARALREFGFEVSPESLRRPLLVADEFIYQEIARASLSQRPREEQMAVWAQYERIMLKEAGIEADERIILGLLGKMEQADMKLVLFDDVMPALTSLQGRGLTLGLISNADRDLTPLLSGLGLLPLLQVVVTSQDVGGTKPQPEIFQEAARRAEVGASEAVYVGDQYQIDVVGAEQAGMKGILLDRDNYFAEITDCPRIQSLAELAEHLASRPS